MVSESLPDMPSVTVHLRLAEDVLDHWRTRTAQAPFAPDDDEAVNAFRLGAMGPDMRYLRGGLNVLSDLAHSLLPAPPRLWFLNAVRDVEETFLDIFLEEYEGGCATLPNVNLDTGRPDVTETEYLGLRRAIDFLISSGGRIPRPQEVISGAA